MLSRSLSIRDKQLVDQGVPVVRRKNNLMPEFPPDTFSSTGFALAQAEAAVRDFGQAIGADRCFLYVRYPAGKSGRIAACWRRSDETPDLPEHDYEALSPEPAYLHEGDPMFTAALAGYPATYIDDIETAAGLVNVVLERSFRHRALVHINLSDAEGLWGILQPAMSCEPRAWSAEDRVLVETWRRKLTPQLKAALQAGPWPHEPVRSAGG